MKTNAFQGTPKQIAICLIVALFAIGLFIFPFSYSAADVGDGKLTGNLNYNTCYPCSSSGLHFTPDNEFDWTTTATVSSGSCSGCWSEQVQLYNGATGSAGIVYQEVIIETTNGNGGCTSTICNLWCVSDWKSNGACISESFKILTNDKLDASGWSAEFYASLDSNGNVKTFWLQVYGPNGFNDLFTMTDPNQTPIYATRMNIVGADSSYSTASFTAGAGTNYYYNAGYKALYQYAGYTTEDSNMAYGSMSGNGGTTFTQSYTG